MTESTSPTSHPRAKNRLFPPRQPIRFAPRGEFDARQWQLDACKANLKRHGAQMEECLEQLKASLEGKDKMDLLETKRRVRWLGFLTDLLVAALVVHIVYFHAWDFVRRYISGA